MKKILIYVLIFKILFNKNFFKEKNTCSLDEKETLPILVFHGANDTCRELNYLIIHLKKFTNSKIYCVIIGSKSDSIFRPIEKLIDNSCKFAEKYESILKNGFHVIGLSTGGLIGRGLIQKCKMGKLAKNYLGFGVPQMGVSSMPKSDENFFNRLWSYLVKCIIYIYFMQNYITSTNFFKEIDQMDTYKKLKTTYLKELNNEYFINEQFKERIKNLKLFINYGFKDENYLVPKITTSFGYHDLNK